MEPNDMNEPKFVPMPTNKFQCTICQKSFCSASNLKKHISNTHIDDNDKAFPCTVCLETKQLVKCYKTQLYLNNHIKWAHGQDTLRFKCEVCLKTYKGSAQLAKHKLIHSQTDKKYKCHLCSKSFHFNNRLRNHLFHIHKLKLENSKYFKCELCSREFVCRPTLETHVVKTHVVDKAFECPVCLLKFINHEIMEKHLKSHDKPRSHICDICSKGFIVIRSLISHLRVNHNHFFYCDRCRTPFRNKSDFDEHIICNLNSELKCSLCQTLFESECNLKIHTASHVNEIKIDKMDINVENLIQPTDANQSNKPESTIDLNLEKFQCELCSKAFDRKEYVRVHRKLIHPKAGWKCNIDQCSRSFKDYSLFKYHKMDHLKEEIFVCNICQKSFYRPDSLKKHKLRHFSDKKFKCEQCPTSYKRKSALRVHVAMKHGGPKLFKCPKVDCGTSWANSSTLKKHLISHETMKPFKCELCTPIKDFKHIIYLKAHQRRVHMDTPKI